MRQKQFYPNYQQVQVIPRNGDIQKYIEICQKIAMYIDNFVSMDNQNDFITSKSPNQKPSISLYMYLLRISYFLDLSSDFLYIAICYVHQILDKNIKFRITNRNSHKLVFLSTMLGLKFYSDKQITNSEYSFVSGIDNSLLNQLENEFLIQIDYDLIVDIVQFNKIKRKLENI